MTIELTSVGEQVRTQSEGSTPSPTTEVPRDFTPVTRNTTDTSDLLAARRQLGSIPNNAPRQWEIDITQAQILIHALSREGIPDYIQIIALSALVDEEGNSVSSLDEREAFARRLNYNCKPENMNKAHNGIDYVGFLQTATEKITSETYLLYGSTLLGLTPQQTLHMLDTAVHEVHSGQFHSFLLNPSFDADRIWVFGHSDFNVDSLPRPSLHRYRENRELQLWGRTFHVVRDDGYSVTVAEGRFPIPKGVVEKQNPYTRTEKVLDIVLGAVDLAGHVAFQAQLSAIMIAQLGGIHPAVVDGELMWVMEPWARVNYAGEREKDDYPHYFAAENKYTQKLEEWKARVGRRRVITEPEMEEIVRSVKGLNRRENALPMLGVSGLSLTALNNHRVNGALSAKVAIPIIPLRGVPDMR